MPVAFHSRIVSVPMEQVRPNSFNSNEVSESEQQKIKEDILANGFFGAILVRPVEKGAYEIVDGEHRWRALKDLGVGEVPCLIVEHDDHKAKINSIRLNTERGTQNPKKVGMIVKSLQDQGISLSQLETDLVYSSEELLDRTDLLSLPDNVEDIIREREAMERSEMNIVFSFMVPSRYTEFVEQALDLFGESKGLSFGEMCRKYVEDSRGA